MIWGDRANTQKLSKKKKLEKGQQELGKTITGFKRGIT